MSSAEEKVFVIAEAGVNHNGDLDAAMRLVEVAAEAGADAVKFQTFQADRLVSREAPMAEYQKAGPRPPDSQLKMLRQLELPHAWHRSLQDRARSHGIEFLSTAFDAGSLAFLQSLELPRYKVPSGELTNAPLLWQFGRTGKPLIVSTGMATLADIERALAVIAHASVADREPDSLDEALACWGTQEGREAVAGRVCLLHCTSQYPTRITDVNLRAMATMSAAFGLPVGYSDHTAGQLAATAAVACGARIIEKHFTLDRSMPGPDHRASLEPHELAQMIADIRQLELALGDGRKVPRGGEWDMRSVARQQVIAAREIRKGKRLDRADLGTARCGRGLPAHALWDLVGKTAARDFLPGEVIDP
ncbi:MAG TPA: N-acetylneuraminate synthase [Frateuria sp.]|uniref:N-acetylneuraminate synthase n=1 Tax=Frateuria sp. TaxID=2211372 RepID=UPI002D7F0525|nr:N-acetylneuraminate synthase [Frateuria sp.]HET6804142.1 N-acetylneuraminate synthase [Frateuria sp.]